MAKRIDELEVDFRKQAELCVSEAEKFPNEAAHAQYANGFGSTTIVVFDGLHYHVCDNGEEVDTTKRDEAIRFVDENLSA